MSRQGAYWTESEVSALLNAIKTNVSIYEIKNIHGRTEGSIMSMLRKIASTYHFRDKLPVSQIQELTGLSEKTVNTVISEGPRVGKTDYIKRVKPVTHAIMEFPITKERLQNFTDEYKRLQNNKFIQEVVSFITENILSIAGRGGKQYKLIGIKSGFPIKNYTGISHLEHLDSIIQSLKEKFPDILIYVDILKTYMLVDWN